MVRLRLGRVVSINLQSGALCPFLYQTRTIASHRRPPASSTASANQDEENTLTFLQQKARDVEARGNTVESTITPTEREIFENIMRKFGAKIDGIILPQETPSEDLVLKELDIEALKNTSALSSPRLVPTSTDPADTSIDAILSLFAPIDSFQQFSTFTDGNDTHQDPEERILSQQDPHTPHLIRLAARQSLQHIADNIRSGLSSNTSPPDLAVWRVLETDVFPLITLLRTQRSPLNINPYQRPLSSLSSTDTLPPSLTSTPQGTPILPLITILFPAATILALRIYVAHLSASGFALALLPKIHSLGPASYLLAANTYLFNTLIYLQWTVYSDLCAINALLGEMKRNGVEYDRQTLALIEGIMTHRKEDTQDGEEADSRRGKDWWEMKRNKDWLKRIVRKRKWDISKQVTGSEAQPAEDQDHATLWESDNESDREIR